MKDLKDAKLTFSAMNKIKKESKLKKNSDFE